MKKILVLLLPIFLLSCATNDSNHTNTNNQNVTRIDNDYIYYRVKRGDNLFQISKRYNVSVYQLKKLNSLSSDEIEVGQLLKIKRKTSDKSSINNRKNTGEKNVQYNSNAIKNISFVWPARGTIVQNFNGHSNKGINIKLKPKSNIVASAKGKVIYIDQIKGYGNLILISHDNKYQVLTAYAGSLDILVKKEQTVRAGEKIAITKNDDNINFHFEIRNGTQAVNPVDYLK